MDLILIYILVVGQGSNSVEPHAESNSAITFSNRANQPSEPTTLPLKPSPEPYKPSPEPTKPSTEVAASMSGLGGGRVPSKEASPAKPGPGVYTVPHYQDGWGRISSCEEGREYHGCG